MSRARSRGAARPAAGGSRPPRRLRARIVVLTGIALVLVVATLLLRPQRPGERFMAPASATDFALRDSLAAADASRDWVRAVRWAERLGARRPYDHTVLLARGIVWSNFAIDQRRDRLRPRPALRTSLERIGCMRRSLGLIDSSSVAADTRKRWVDSGNGLAGTYETLGLPGDALIAYETIKQRLPDERYPAMRAYMLRALLYDPVHPDTSELDRFRRREAGR